MATKPTPLHSGHRERMKEKFRENGLETFADHEVLEFLLFYSIAQRNTNPIGHELMDRFLSVSGVFDADFDELLSIKGISSHSATLIKLIPELCQRYLEDKSRSALKLMTSPENLKNLVISLFVGKTTEELYIICLDKMGKLISYKKISSGTLDASLADMHLIAETIAKSKASRIMLCHNHPSGIPFASDADIQVTKSVKSLAENMGVFFDDHFIVADGAVISMRSQRLFDSDK